MAILTWDTTGQRYYETGVDHVVLYPINDDGSYGKGIAWNGVISVTESPSGAEATPLYADNIKYLNFTSNEDFAGSIEAYAYPDEFAACLGQTQLFPDLENAKGIMIGQQPRKMFGLSYRTLIGNDVQGTAKGYKLHIVYGALASVSEKAYSTVNESPEAMTLSWEFTTTPVSVAGFKPTAHIEIDSTKVDPSKLGMCLNKLYGTNVKDAGILMPSDIYW